MVNLRPAEQYAADVLSGAAPAGVWLRKAIERDQRDLEDGDERGLWFDVDLAQHIIDFFSFLKHSKGRWAGTPIHLEPWQEWLLSVLFGWQREDPETGLEVRRYRQAYLKVARKNGKSTMAAGVGLYLMQADGEPGAEIYSAATKTEQARIVFDEAKRMVQSSAALRHRIKAYSHNLNILGTAAKFEPLSRDTKSMDGLNVHGALIDELHAHPTGEVWDLLNTATGARTQPLLFAITTAGSDTTSVCWEQHQYTEQILDGVIEDDAFFGLIYATDEGDDWQDPANWYKANPNLGVSKSLTKMEEDALAASQQPSRLNSFLRLHLDQWVSAESRWLDPSMWAACGGAVNLDGLRGRTCYGGLDLSTTTDISAFVLIFAGQDPQDAYQVLCRFWIPEDAMAKRAKRDRVPYDSWVRQGFIEATPGNVIDYDYIMAGIGEDAERFDLELIAFDRWGATKIATDLANLGLDLVQFGQGYASMSAPTKELEKLILSKQLAHGANPVLTWMANNVVVRSDPAGNIKPDKEKSPAKIDGIVALIMALDLALRQPVKAPSIYESRGI